MSKKLVLTGATALAVGLLGAAPAQAAETFYNPIASDFSPGADGWSGSNATCGPINGVGALCNSANEHSGLVGNPGGSITQRSDVTVNALGLFRATGRWTSSEFGVRSGSTPKQATFAYDRRLEPGGLINLVPRTRPQVTLVNLSNGRQTKIADEVFSNRSYARRRFSVPAGLLTPGQKYRLRLDSTTTTALVGAGVLGTSRARYDNISMTVAATPDGGAEVSPGVEIVNGPVSITVINMLNRTVNWAADFGTQPGGSVVPLSRCTIIGTPGNDVIKGTNGNDVICGLGGNDRINGRGGRDFIDGGDGSDRLGGDSGADTLAALRGRDRLDGGSSKDRLGGGAENDRAGGGSGNDRVRGGSGNDLVRGRSGNDSLEGNRGGDRVIGDSGRDRLFGQTGRDRLLARDGRRDRVDGGSGRDSARVDRRMRRPDILRAMERAR